MDVEASYHETDSDNVHSVHQLSLKRDDIANLYGFANDNDYDDDDDDDDDDHSNGSNGEPVHIRTLSTRKKKEQTDLEKRFIRQVFTQVKKPTKNREGYFELHVDNFRIFKTVDPRRAEPLHLVALSSNKTSLQYSVSGLIRHENGITEQVEALDITGVYIRNFGRLDGDDRPATSSCRNAIYLETRLSNSRDFRYLLQSPSASYEDIFLGFLWLATFTKHVHDYLQWSLKSERSVSLDDFRESFYIQLEQWYSDDADFVEWLRYCSGTTDFRQHIVCAHHAYFIYDQICRIKQSDHKVLLSQPLWKEIAPQRLRNPGKEKTHLDRPTPVTAWLKEVFLNGFPQWRRRQEREEDLIVAVDPTPEILSKRNKRSEQLSLGDKLSRRQADHFDDQKISVAALLLEEASRSNGKASYQNLADQLSGKAVVLRMDTDNRIEYRYAYVREVRNNGRQLSVRWLLLPSSTVCEGRSAGRSQTRQKTFYPIGNELFFSDECCCETVATYRVVADHNISVLQDHALPEHKLFVHRQYLSQDHAICELPPNEINLCLEHDWKDIGSQRRLSISKTINKTRTEEGITPGNILSLFSGCGLLDRGFEVGADGEFETTFAADFNLAALMSHKLNHPHPDRCEFQNADINVLWEKIVRGKRPFLDIAVLISGCPCQGFTSLNNNKDEDEARKNCSMLAQTLAWVDIFRPVMVLVENVTRMDPLGTTGTAKTASAAGQAIAALVSMGYQARLVTVKASDYGGATMRERLFIFATVPGIPLPRIPPPSHGAENDQCALVTASMATLGLNRIHNSTYVNPCQPDHVPFLNLGDLVHGIVTKIPTMTSKNRNNLFAARSKFETKAEIEWFENLNVSRRSAASHSFCRMKSNSPMHTIVTSFNLSCNRTGTLLHWLEHRACSLLELRRGHGVPDDYILVGDRGQQLHHIGNSVAWVTAKVLGRAFAEA